MKQATPTLVKVVNLMDTKGETCTVMMLPDETCLLFILLTAHQLLKSDYQGFLLELLKEIKLVREVSHGVRDNII